MIFKSLNHDWTRLQTPFKDISHKAKRELNKLNDSYHDFTNNMSSDKLLSLCDGMLSLSKSAKKKINKKHFIASPWLAVAAVTVVGGLVLAHKIKANRLTKSLEAEKNISQENATTSDVS